MAHWKNEVTSIAFTFDDNNNAYHSVALLVIIAHRIMQPISGRQMSLLTLFPESYTSLPKHLICKICALIVAVFRAYLSDQVYIFTHALDKEHHHQLELLATARLGTDKQSVELEHWLTTCNGSDGWQTKLEQVLKQSNGL
ncbi:hypothetical protein DFH29DRAFT_1004333 [Suillus ampliporus]|nr:hypothetical protein DFH29DRAFT_1004333 [Suillus ampliporus]